MNPKILQAIDGALNALGNCGAQLEYNALSEAKEELLKTDTNPAMQTCSSCHGQGQWECECCNGANGCECHGQPVAMGKCGVCHGTGKIRDDGIGVNKNANLDQIRGRCFIGSGPKSGYWAGR